MTALEREIAAAIAQASASLARAGAAADDLAQDGWIASLEALPGFDPSIGPVGAYLWPVLTAQLGKAAARARHPLTLSERAARNAPAFELAPVDDVPDDDATPEQLVAEAEARARVREAIAAALAEMPARAAEIAANDLGEPSPVVAARLGVADARVRRVRIDFARRVRAVVG